MSLQTLSRVLKIGALCGWVMASVDLIVWLMYDIAPFSPVVAVLMCFACPFFFLMGVAIDKEIKND